MNEELNKLLTKQPILLFDGECGFCNRAVLFVLNREKKNPGPGKKLHFAPLESPQGKLLRDYFEISQKVDSMILVKQHSAYIKSCAALRLTIYMRGLWPLMMIFVLIPPFIRNIVYDFIARRRKKIFGKTESCALLKNEDAQRFLDRKN